MHPVQVQCGWEARPDQCFGSCDDRGVKCSAVMDTSAGAGRDSRFNLGYNMSLLSGETSPEMYGGRPSTSLSSGMSRSGMNMSGACAPGLQRGLKRTSSDVCFVDQDVSGRSGMGLSGDCGSDLLEDSYSPAPQKSTPPPNGKKTKGRVKIKMEYIDNKLRRYTTFSKRKTGIMKKVRGPSVSDGSQVPVFQCCDGCQPPAGLQLRCSCRCS